MSRPGRGGVAKALLRAEMVRRGMNYDDLAAALARIGIVDNVPNLRNKVSRGQFTAVFLLDALRAIGVEWIQIPAEPPTRGK